MSEVKHEVLLQAKGIYKNFETSKKDQAVHALTIKEFKMPLSPYKFKIKE